MSWSVSATLEGFEHSAVGLQKAFDTLNSLSPVGNENVRSERDDQVTAAIDAACSLLTEGGFANAAVISVSLAGHANKDHKKDPAWTNDYISVQIHILRYREPADPDALKKINQSVTDEFNDRLNSVLS